MEGRGVTEGFMNDFHRSPSGPKISSSLIQQTTESFLIGYLRRLINVGYDLDLNVKTSNGIPMNRSECNGFLPAFAGMYQVVADWECRPGCLFGNHGQNQIEHTFVPAGLSVRIYCH